MYNWNDISPKQLCTLYSFFNSDILVLLLFHLMISCCYSCFKKLANYILFPIFRGIAMLYNCTIVVRVSIITISLFLLLLLCCIVWYLLILHLGESLDVDFFMYKNGCVVRAVCSSSECVVRWHPLVNF